MLQLVNRTPYQTEGALLLDINGAEVWVVVVKATFEVTNGKLLLADEQEPVCLVDEYNGEPGASSMKYENELVFNKPGTDIVINGHAYAPQAKPVTKMDVNVRVGRNQKTIRVFGDRIWYRSFVGLSISKPKPFVKMPLIYERAFGGTDTSGDKPRKHGTEHRNPIGVGFAMSKSFLKDKPLPNLEEPANRIKGWKSRPKPAGFGFICKHWKPRRQYAGTYDQKWVEHRLPLYPLDFNFRFFLGAHPDMVAIPHLHGGEPVELFGLTPGGCLTFNLPQVDLNFSTRLEGKWINHCSKLGTVIIEPDIPRVMMTWQTSLPCHRKRFELEETEIREERVNPCN
ncbi:MAG: hypothetical protein BBJ57_01065 [Desulfobacterales bacterium PC51MH44]|nr:MAG: hypothetical protein BBJ57_01065 [Desulfobacterales bacterium PC51MH44]